MVEGYSGESEFDDCPAFKEARSKNIGKKAADMEGPGSVVQRMKARRARTCPIPVGGVRDVVSLDDDDESS